MPHDRRQTKIDHNGSDELIKRISSINKFKYQYQPFPAQYPTEIFCKDFIFIFLMEAAEFLQHTIFPSLFNYLVYTFNQSSKYSFLLFFFLVFMFPKQCHLAFYAFMKEKKRIVMYSKLRLGMVKQN